QRGIDALAHLGVVHDDGHSFVCPDSNKRVWHEGGCRSVLRGGRFTGFRQPETDEQTAARSDRNSQEFSTWNRSAHLLMAAPCRACIRSAHLLMAAPCRACIRSAHLLMAAPCRACIRSAHHYLPVAAGGT